MSNESRSNDNFDDIRAFLEGKLVTQPSGQRFLQLRELMKLMAKKTVG